MKNLFFAGTFLLACTFSFAQYSIVQKANIPSTYRHHASGFAINGMGYLGQGEDNFGNLLNDWWMYNPGTDTWTQKNNTLMSARSYCGSFSIGNKGYITCGNTATSYLNSLWEYDPAADSWTQKTSFPGAARRHPCMAVVNGEAYVGCGDGSTGNYNDFYKYNPATNAWTAIPVFIGTRRHHPVAVSMNGKLYVGTGHDLNNVKCKDFYVFNPGTNSWSQIADIPGIGRIAPFGLVLNNNMVVGWGADEGTTNYNDYFRYNISNNTWTSYTYTANVCLFASVFFEINGKGYVGSGTYAGNCQNEFYEFTDPATDVNAIENDFADVSVFPNPSDGEFTVCGLSSAVELSVYDVLGKKVYQSFVNNHLSLGNSPMTTAPMTIDLSSQPSGVYFYKVIDGSSVIANGKLVVR